MPCAWRNPSGTKARIAKTILIRKARIMTTNPDPNVVAFRTLSDDEAIEWLRTQPDGRIRATAAELGRRWNWHRQRVGRRLDAWQKAGLVKWRGRTVTALAVDGVTGNVTTPVTATVPEVAIEAPIPPRIEGPPTRWTAGAVFLAGIALAIATLALFVNGQTGWAFGTTPLAAVTFAGLSLAADLLAIALPATAAALWGGRHRVLATTAWAVWMVAAAMATLASLGFAEMHIGDTAAGRQSVITTSASLATQRQDRIEAARLAATAVTRAREAECTRRGPMCREREADERAALAALNSAVSAPVPTAAPIAGADPQVAAALRLSTWAGMGIKADDIVNLRLALMALLPNVAGLLLAFASGLVRQE